MSANALMKPWERSLVHAAAKRLGVAASLLMLLSGAREVDAGEEMHLQLR